MSVQEKMTAIADAIREKTGGTEPLTLDQMAAAIENMGAGAFTGILEAAGGEFVPASDVSAMSIPHGLSGSPHFCAFWATGALKASQLLYGTYAKLLSTQSNPTISTLAVATGTDKSIWGSTDYNARGGIGSVDDTNINIVRGNMEKLLTAGTRYCWLAVILDIAGGVK